LTPLSLLLTRPCRLFSSFIYFDCYFFPSIVPASRLSRGKGKEVKLSPPPPKGANQGNTSHLVAPKTRAVVLHAASTKYKPGQMRRLIEEDYQVFGTKVGRIRLLVREDRRTGKLAASLVIYLNESTDPNQGLRIGRKAFRTTVYEWSRR